MAAPDFAPSSLPPALRARFFATHLPEFGWQPTVITTDARYYGREVDPQNLALLPPTLRVVRTPAVPEWLSRRLGVGDVGMRSIAHHWRALARMCRAGQVDLVFISVPPYVTSLLGRMAFERFGVPYVVDYIDPWVSDYHRRLPPRHRPGGYKWEAAQWLARRLEPFALRRAAHVVGVAPGYTDPVIARYPWLSAADATAIPYGGEPADFDYLRSHPRPNPIFDSRDGHLHVSHVGRGGADLLPALRALFGAVKLGLMRDPELFARSRLHFVGTSYAPGDRARCEVLLLARELGLGDIVDERPARVSYLDAMQVMLDSHCLLVIGSELSYYSASKIFPAILSGRPVLAVFHEASPAVEVMSATRAGEVVTFSDARPPLECEAEIADRFAAVLRRSVDSRPQVSSGSVAGCTAWAAARRLAKVFDQVLASAPQSAAEDA
jgi:hypothetical protein